MKLLYSPTSPYSRKVLVLASETGVDAQLEVEVADPWPGDSRVGQFNPLGKVPALITGDGRVLYDSPVICEYLDAHHDGAKFFPPVGEARWHALAVQALSDGILDATVLMRLESMRPEEKRHEPWAQRQLSAVRRSLAVLEGDAEILKGAPSIAHISVGCALGYLDFRLSEEDWRASHPQLESWFATWSKRPSMESTAPPSG